MKNFIIISAVLTFSISCHSQTRGLSEAAISTNNAIANNVIQNTSYLKDVDNSLNKFEGIWKGEYNGKVYEFRLVKKIKYGENPQKDIILGRFEVKDSSGTIIYSTLNNSDVEAGLKGINFQSGNKIYHLNYTESRNGCGKSGVAYIYFKDPNDLKTLSLGFMSDGDIMVKGKCDNYTPLLPYSDIAILRLKKQ
ncbi:DUF6705 family protein [Elizabethkingia ursingii]|uniref:DUF6705 family protein n=1 Tax=Elizabethkingia ursingii TaxID=1756150 RepID=UPI002012DCE3|nr:DUF6705 family protein [Elizabethkingia ursingii]MCL1672192.1 hypothetical protein [Elizabethkingia ursingii]